MASSRRARISALIADVTVYDCADAVKLRRSRKNNHNYQVSEDTEEEEDAESTFSYSAIQKCRVPDDVDSIEYPEILFFLLAEYIPPEDVGRFAGINRAAAAATRRAAFWRGVYARYCRPSECLLPELLRLHHDTSTYAIRQRVVCALYRVYAPFLKAESERRRSGATKAVLSQLVGLRCVDVWYEKETSSMRWKYYVKLKPNIRRNPTSNVMANPEEHSVLLIASNNDRVAVPAAMGLLVSGAGASLAGAALDTRRVHLDLTRALHLASPTPTDCSLVLHSVHELETVRWWQPRFPVFTASPPQILPLDPGRPILDTDFLTMV